MASVGYVKIAGMIDELDTEQMAQPAQPWESFQARVAALIVMLMASST